MSYQPSTPSSAVATPNGNISSLSKQSMVQNSISPQPNNDTETPEQIEARQQKEGLARVFLVFIIVVYASTHFSFVKVLADKRIPTGLSLTIRFGIAAIIILPWLFLKTPEYERLKKAKRKKLIAKLSKAPTHTFTKDASIETVKDKMQFLQRKDEEAILDEEYDVDNYNKGIAAIAIGVEVGLWNSIGYIAQAIALETVSVNRVGFVASLITVAAPLEDLICYSRRLYLRHLVGILLVVGGVVLIEMERNEYVQDTGRRMLKAILEASGSTEEGTLSTDEGTLSTDEGTLSSSAKEGAEEIDSDLDYVTPRFSSGDLLCFLQPFVFAIGFFRMQSAIQKYPYEGNRATAAQIVTIFLVCIIYTAIAEPESFTTLPNRITNNDVIFCLVWTGLITILLRIRIENYALKFLPAVETILFFAICPLFNYVSAIYMVGEQVSIEYVIGMMLVMVGIVYSTFGYSRIMSFFFEQDDDEEVDENETEEADDV